MTTRRSRYLTRAALALSGAVLLLASLMPAATLAATGANQRYLVVFKGGYALDGSYALGKGYALVAEGRTYALDGTYALGRQYALYALNRTYALANQYALTDQYALTHTYALFGQYALGSGYALDDGYALGSGYLAALLTGSTVIDSSYALLESTVGYALGDQYALLDAYALDKNYALARDYALKLVSAAGGNVAADLTRQTGMMLVDSKNTAFAQALRASGLVAEVGKDFGAKVLPSYQEAIASGQLILVNNGGHTTSGPDPLESQQWGLSQIHAPQAHTRQLGKPAVEVGILDTGIDGNHQDFVLNGRSNVNCQKGADFTAVGPGIGIPSACIDNQFHGTHVAGIVAARRNGLGVVGVAPNVTLIPIKVCDAGGSCYVSDAVQGITYAGDLKLDVINMSFFVDDDDFQQSTEFKCQSDPTQRAYRAAIERALAYARSRGVTLISALGNSDVDLANPPTSEGGKNCKVVPAQVDGVIGTAALGPRSEKAEYSNWGAGWTDVSAPGGNDLLAADCTTEVLSTIPGGWACFQGTSMASPHTAGVAALIVSQFGSTNGAGNVSMGPDAVAKKLFKTAIDIGKVGADKCFGKGRIDALRAVRNQTTYLYDSTAPACAE